MELIDVDAIASALAVSRRYAVDRVVHRPDFPRPALALSRKTKRWSREEFEKWMRTQRPTR